MQQRGALGQLVVLLAISVAVARADPPAREVAQAVGLVYSDIALPPLDLGKLGAAETSRILSAKVPDATWFRLQLTVEANQPLREVSVSIADAFDNVFETVNLHGKTRLNFWTKFMTSNEYVIRVNGPAQTQGTLKIVAMARERREFEPLSIVEPDERVDISTVSDGPTQRAARAVLKIYYQESGATRTCSGFLIARQRIVTNEHCVNSQALCDTAVALFDHLDDGMAPPAKQSRCVTFKKADPILDISVLDFDATIPNAISPFQLGTKSPADQQKIQIIQFASNEAKKISVRDCSAVKNPVDGYDKNTDFSHRCDTMKGSSGSPVLTPAFEVIGLHHLAIDELVPYNRAVQIERVRAWLQSNGLLP